MKVCDECSGLGMIRTNTCDVCFGEGYVENIKSSRKELKGDNQHKKEFDDAEYMVSYSKGVNNKRRTNHR